MTCGFRAFLVSTLALMTFQACAQESSPVAENPPVTATADSTDPGWLSRTWNTVVDGATDIVENGGWDVYLPVRTIHMPYAYSYEQRHYYNNSPWGGGIGRGKYLDNGDWHGFYAIEFKDSKRYPSWAAGYMYRLLWGDSNGFYGGVGASVFLMTRHDFNHYTPFPGIIPIVTLGFRNIAVETTWVPGFAQEGVGNVMMVWLKFEEKSRPRK